MVPSWGHLYLGWNEPAIAPLGEAVPNTELWRRLARAMGFTDPELSTRRRVAAHVRAPRTSTSSCSASRASSASSSPRTSALRRGRLRHAPAGRAELLSEALAAQGHDPLPAFVAGRRRAPAGDPELAERFPLLLLTPKTHTRFLNSSYSHLPKHGPLEGGPFVELDPADATARGLADGDPCGCGTTAATLTMPARLTGRLRPGVVAVPFGWWGDTAATPTPTPSPTTPSPTGAAASPRDTLVEVELVRRSRAAHQ